MTKLSYIFALYLASSVFSNVFAITIGNIINNPVIVTTPGAAGYMIEYHIPSPVFAEENAPVAEYITQTIQLTPQDYEVYDDLILFNIELQTGMEGTTVEGRVFALDGAGNIIAESVSSEHTTVIWK